VFSDGDRMSKALRWFLVEKAGMASLKIATVDNSEHYYILYKEPLKDLLSSLPKADNILERDSVPVAFRKLESIDYVNKRDGDFAFTFSYSISTALSSLPQVTNRFKGKAAAMRDPDDGEWKLRN